MRERMQAMSMPYKLASLIVLLDFVHNSTCTAHELDGMQ